MSIEEQHLKNSTTLLRALDAVKNFRAIAIIGITALVSGLMTALFSYFSVSLAGNGNTGVAMTTVLLGFILTAVVFTTGLSGAGIQLMDQAKGNPARSVGDTLLAALATLPRILGVFLLEMVGFLALVIVLAVVLFICKVPGLGAFLYTFVFPTSVVVTGLTLFTLAFVFTPLAMPALWDGNTVMQVVAKLMCLARTSLFPVIIQQFLLAIMVGFLGMVIGGIVSSGLMVVGGLSTAILPSAGSGGLMMLLSAFSGLYSNMGESGGYFAAAAFGGMLVIALAAVLPMLVYVMGSCLIYLTYARNLKTEEIEGALRHKLDDLKEKAAAAREQLKQAPVAQGLQTDPPMSASSHRTCFRCGGPASPDDMFCGSCGQKLN